MNQNWKTFLDQVYSEIEKFDSDKLFFRGHSDEKHELLPTLHRNKIDNLENVENNLFYDFVSMAGSKIKNENSWEILFQMRHHGIPTRLIDWSTSFAVALYFALSAKKLNKPHIWIFDPYKLSEKNDNFPKGLLNPYYDLKNDYVELFVNMHENHIITRPEFPLPLYPPRNSSRIFAQHGVFTMHGLDNSKMESLTPECLIKIEIPEDCILEARKFLFLAGVNEYSIFPDFDGLAKHLKTIHKLN